ncbi:MAG TPA: flagellar biosynthesis protein FlgL [Pseudolabrys sp.]|jgi:flagellin-like hook-associated protein FlgL|uniref:flagellin N-terminal helical domain-containing protein n=1 Tax=Pseudolabrys sp. TaxID=1960880 RepID=UPI002DDCF1C4|nr:flagellar biosynthesis protein FlgL [Pseudolabrys sp.]HEV2629063.1 flagellar biosynthesis protein FlgL [Pseudolabrys sp.]
MSINSVNNAMIQSLVNMRSQFTDLQQQLSSGQKSQTYAGLGVGSGLTVSLNAQLSAISGFDNGIDMAMTRVGLAQTALNSMGTIGDTVKSLVLEGNTTGGNANTAQLTAQSSLQQILGLLNTQSGNGYLFSGSSPDQPSVATYDDIMNGSGTRAGLTQIISERNQADLGASGLGRLTLSTAGSTASVAEDAVSPFGFKLAGVTSSLTNATVSGPSGSPAAVSVNFTGAPNDGDAITLNFNLPDGTTQNLTLTATSQSPPGANQFTIGATPAATAANFQSALTTAVGGLAATSLKAASTVTASNDFFNADTSSPPQRVAGPPYDTATSLTAGTAANTVIWYTGEDGAGSARSSASTRIDPSLVVSYGTRANESALRNLVQNVATLAAVTISPSDPNGAALSTALGQRLSTAMSGGPGVQTISDIETELAGAQASMNSSKSTHQQTSATLTNMLQGITGISNEQVGAELLSLQNQMAATMQTTAMLYQTSLVNYLK